jgi:hypothetical protein
VKEKKVINLLQQWCRFSLNDRCLFFFFFQIRHGYSLCRVYVKSESLRSFDRRPMVNMTSGTTSNIDQSSREGASSSNLGVISHQNPSKVERADSSSSGDHTSHTLAEDSVNDDWKMIGNLDTLWDWMD